MLGRDTAARPRGGALAAKWREGSTCFANVTTWECERPATILDIDPATRHVVAVCVPPAAGRPIR
jgi:hypothetical protein